MNAESETSDAPAKEKPAAERLLALDAFRGLTILAMILVNNPGSWGHLYPPLAHAEWHGWTPTDLIFPFFLFIVGTAMAYGLRKYCEGEAIDRRVYLRIIRRTIVLFLLGLLLNGSGQLFRFFLGEPDVINFAALRIPGVLQRIAIVHCVASLLVLHLNVRWQVVAGLALLLGYWALLAFLPTDRSPAERLSPEGNIVRMVDIATIGKNHMYTRATIEPTEPEGLLSNLPSIVTTLLGYWTGLFIQRQPKSLKMVGGLAALGAVCLAIGLAWDVLLPINKKIWTSSYVLTSGGLAMICLAGCLLVFDVWGFRRAARPFAIVGVNAIFVFVASGLVGRLLVETHVGELTTKTWLYQKLFAAHLSPEELASLGFALATVAFWWLILWLMSLRDWTIRV